MLESRLEDKEKPMNKFMKKTIIGLISVLGCIVIYHGVKAYMMASYFKHMQPPPVTVSAKEAKLVKWSDYVETNANLSAVSGIELAPEVSGVIVDLTFQDGDKVSQGQLLVKLNTSIEEAELKNARVQLKLAEMDFQRNQTLFKSKAISQAALDRSTANLEEAQASVEKIQAIINQKNIKAPFSGKLGIRQISVGQFVSAGTPLVSLQALDELNVRFSIAEAYINKIAVGQDVRVKVPGENDFNYQGKVNAINASVDGDTRMMLIEAVIKNSQAKLYPGMSAVARVILQNETEVIVVPQTAVTYSLYGDSVYVVKEEGKDKQDKSILKASRVFVRLGERRNDEVVILEGVKPNDLVVTSGQLKLENGSLVTINNDLKTE